MEKQPHVSLASDASYNKEEEWKFRYVYKGPNKAKQKKVYYVYGKGLRNNPTSPGNHFFVLGGTMISKL